MFDDNVTVPAGWYPDPMGLPQLRWWNNHAWTELTTEARPPLVMQQPTRVMYADDDDLPTRRQQREQRERDEQYVRLATAEGEDDASVGGAVAFAEPQLELATPDEPEQIVPFEALVAEIPVATPATVAAEDVFEPGEPVGDGYSPRSATTAVSAPTVQSSQTTAEADGGAARSRVIERPATYTAPVWIIALVPVLQLVVALLLLLGFGSSLGATAMIVLLAISYLFVVGMAIVDYTQLSNSGHERPAHWAWAFLSAPIYLIARSMRLSRSGEPGFAPLLVWAALALLQVGSIIVVPGIIVATFPVAFSHQAEASVVSIGSVINTNLHVTCPATPPVLVGSTFTCSVANNSGKSGDVVVRLDRVNGWIAWSVADWGVFASSN